MQGNRLRTAFASTVLIAALGLPVMAQQPGQPGGGQGRQGRGGFGQRGGFGRQVTVANVPVEALAKSLSLSANQKTQIEAIQTKHREETRALFPQGGGRGGGGGGADPNAFQANMEKIRGMNEQATKDIEAVLNSGQKAKLPGLMKEFTALRGARIPFEVATELKLSPDQLKRIEAVSAEQQKAMRDAFQNAGQGGDRRAMMEKFRAMRQENQQKIEAILTADQKAAIKKYEDAHPRPQRGGRGGGGAPPAP